MEHLVTPPPRAGTGTYVVALVLGTALTTLAPAPAPAQAPPTEATARAVQDISRYCTACWRNAHLDPTSWNDCTQEVFRRLLERVDRGAWEQVLRDEGAERREFLRAIDAVKKRSQRQRRLGGLADNVADRHDQHERRLADEREVVWRAAADLLSPRQQCILRLTCEGWSVQEIAEELALTAERVSDEKYKAVRKLRSHLAERDD